MNFAAPPAPLVALALLAALLAGCRRSGGEAKAVAVTVVPVQTAVAQRQDMPRLVESVGAVQALRTVAVKSQVDGMIAQIHFREGDEVKAGDPLVSLDRRPFENSLRIARAEEAKAQSDLERYKHLDQQDAISKEQFALLGTKDETTRALVQAKEGAVANAELLLGYAQIRAPITGRTGQLILHEGALLKANDVNQSIVTINQLAPIATAYAVSERALSEIRGVIQSGQAVVTVIDRVAGVVRTDGKLTFVDNAVDATSGTITLKATFANADHALWPGQFVQVQTQIGVDRGAIVVPTAAVQTGRDGQQVYIVTKEGTVDLRPVKVLRAFPQLLPPIRLGGSLTKALYQFTLFGTDLKELYRGAQLMEEKIRLIPGLQDVNTDLQISSPQLRVEINRERASSLGITPQQIEDALYSAYGSRQVSTIYTPMNQYFVIMEMAPEFQLNSDALSLIYLRGKSGRTVPLDTVATLKREVGPLTVNHLGQVPAVTISFNLRPGYSLGEVSTVITDLARKELPATLSYGFQGSAQAFASSMTGLGLLLVMAVLVIYVVLGILYEDFIHPLTILSGLPAASFGALFTLWLFKEELNVMGYVGIILLVGIVKKNAIMMIDFALAARAQGETSPEKAIVQACLVRFRPIMMTTFAALASAIPIALGLGAGAESRRPLGLAVVGGLMVSQLLTLYITPVIYVYMDRFTARMRRRKPAAVSAHGEPAMAK